MDVSLELSTTGEEGEKESLDSVVKTEPSVGKTESSAVKIESSAVKTEVQLKDDPVEVVNGCAGVEDKVKLEVLESVKIEESSESSKEDVEVTAGGGDVQ